jgi:hypothetical protein
MAHSFKQQTAAAAAAALAVVADAVDAEICRTFAVETAATGQREFIVTSAQRFWEHYISVNAKQRHHYEIIRQAHPCNLYFGECLQVLLYMQALLWAVMCQHLSTTVTGFPRPLPVPLPFWQF